MTKTASTAQRRSKWQRGYNLIEAAIVLGVVVVVLGGIWTAAASYNETYKVNKTVEGFLTIVRNIQHLISIRDSQSLGYAQNISFMLVDAALAPKDWIENSSIKNAFGGDVYLSTYDSSKSFNIAITGIPRSACVSLLVKLSTSELTSAKRLNLIRIQVNYPSYTLNTTTFPITLDQANLACTQKTNNRIYAYFPYTRIN